ncbi:MAG: hypothetical protein GZ088_09865 [Acidipila sp.]|nr:hypothetical protein [Acidipila sp.]
MIVGTGAMLDYFGTGTINASSLQKNFTIAGPTAPRVYTFPDANATILTTNAAVTVPQGGTGNTTFTPYSLIAAGTVATGPFQNIVGVGTAGQVLTSNGAGTLPTWQATAVTPTPTWAAVLAAGNTTGANNALITTGQQIDAATPATVLNIGNTNASGIGIGTAPGVLGTLQVFVNQGGAAFIGSNAGIQYSSTTSNRGSIRTNQFGNNAGVPGITGFKSRGTNVGDLISVADGDVLWRATAIGVTGNNINVPLAGFLSLQVPTGGTNATWVATDFAVSLVPLAGPINSNRQVFKVTSEAALDFIDGTTAPVTAAAHGGLRYNNALLRFEQSVSGAAWAPLSNTSFSAITTGTNTTAVMTVGTGASLDFSGVGVINASSLQTNFTIAGPTVPRVYTFPDATTTILTTNAAVTVPQGGTGNTTFTAYSVICAGTTATGTFQNVTGVGTAGQVLTSNGAATLPTWQTASGSTAFSAITSGTNTTAAMIVGNGATLKVAQGGSIGTSSLVASTTVLGSAGAALTASNTNSVLVGSSAGAALAGASDINNTFAFAGQSATGSATGANTLIGYNAATSLTIGALNVVIGSGANTVSTTSNAVIIGALSSGTDNSVIIGQNKTSAVANDLIIESGDVGLRRTAASVLQVTNGAGASATFKTSGLIVGYTTVNFAASPYTVLLTDTAISVDTTGGITVINLPAATDFIGRYITVKKDDTSVFSTQINPNGADTIDGAALYNLLKSYESATFISNGVNGWIVVSQANYNPGFLTSAVIPLTVTGGDTVSLLDANNATTPSAVSAVYWGTNNTANSALMVQGKAGQTSVVFDVQADTGVSVFSVPQPTSSLTGADNLLAGVLAGFGLTSGNQNILFGNSAGTTLSTGADNVCIGVGTGQLTNGSQNVFIGSLAGDQSVTNNNVMIGFGAGLSTAGATDSDNTFIGYFAGRTFTGSASGANTCIGANSAGTNGGTGVSNVLIGAASDVVVNASGVIVVGAGSSGATSSIIIGASVTSSTVNDLIIRTGDVGLLRIAAGILSITDGAGVDATVQSASQIASGVTAASTTYAVLITDYLVTADATGGAFAVTLPAAAANKGRIVNVKKTDASVNAVTMTAAGGDVIDGAATQSITIQYAALTLISNGVDTWWIV